MKKYFGGKNLLHEIRNQLAFHIWPDRLERAFDLLTPEDHLDLFIGKRPGNTLLDYAEVLAGVSVMKSRDSSIREAAIDDLVREVVEIAGLFQDVLLGIVLTFRKRHGGSFGLEGQAVEIELKDLPDLDSVRIPWFTEEPSD